MTNEELDALVERLNEPWLRDGFKPADMEQAAVAIRQLKQERDELLGALRDMATWALAKIEEK